MNEFLEVAEAISTFGLCVGIAMILGGIGRAIFLRKHPLDDRDTLHK